MLLDAGVGAAEHDGRVDFGADGGKLDDTSDPGGRGGVDDGRFMGHVVRSVGGGEEDVVDAAQSAA